MNPADPQPLHQTTRLAACLHELGLGEHRPVAHDLVERLAGLIDLSDAFTLSENLRGLPRTPFTAAPTTNARETAEAIKAQFIRERLALMETLVRKSTPGPNNLALGLEAPDSFDMLLRFYTLQQSEMEHQVLKLRLHMRETMSCLSRELKQLALLDAALSDTITQETRKALASLPRLLHKHFVRLQQQPEGYLLFIHDMQKLLLAELDLRLQPLMGLIEALDEEVRY